MKTYLDYLPYRLRSRIEVYTKYFRVFWFSAAVPILVYQMGKVGSTSVSKSLEVHGLWSVFHVHRLNPKHIDDVKQDLIAKKFRPSSGRINKMLYRQLARNHHQAKVITLVRDPINRNISAFFENLKTLLREEDINHYDFKTYTKAFLEEYPQHVPLEWFDKEPKEVLGIDIFDHPFPKESGTLRIEKGHVDWLVLKAEIADRVKEEAIRDFLGIPAFSLTRTNSSSDRVYAEAYAGFQGAIVLPQSYLDEMINARYTRHFYAESELADLWSRWL
jgi:hypothetical protein